MHLRQSNYQNTALERQPVVGTRHAWILLAGGVLIGVLAVICVEWVYPPIVQKPSVPLAAQQTAFDSPTAQSARQLFALSDDELSRYNLLNLNNAVGRDADLLTGVPDADGTVNEWITQLQQAGLRHTAVSRGDREAFWSQAVLFLRDQLKVTLDDVPSATKEPSDVFLAIGLKDRRLTHHTLPLLLAEIAHRMGVPLGLVVDTDHLICRIEAPGEEPINLGFTAKGLQRRTDKELLGSRTFSSSASQPSLAVTPLTNRQLLAWFIGQRSAILMAKGDLAAAEQDLLLARSVFPENRSLFVRMVRLTDLRGPQVLGPSLWASLQGKNDPAARGSPGTPGVPRTPEEVMQFNARNRPGMGVPTGNPSLPQAPRPASPLDRFSRGGTPGR